MCNDCSSHHDALRDVHAAGGLEAVVAHGHGLLDQQVAQLLVLDALLAHRPAQLEALVQRQPVCVFGFLTVSRDGGRGEDVCWLGGDGWWEDDGW